MRKKAIITGAASPDGIGWHAARLLVDQGHHVIVTGVSEQELATTPAHPHIDAVLLDVRDDLAVDALFTRLDRLDILVNCVGTSDPAHEYGPEGFNRTLDINLTGTLRCCVAGRARLAEAKGAIVNVASLFAMFGNPITPGYAASKAGIVQLTKSLAIAWAPDIRVNAVAPGWIKTDMSRPVWENLEWVQAITARTPMQRFGEANELSGPIAFLCSEAAHFITGVTLPVDGGYSCSG